MKFASWNDQRLVAGIASGRPEALGALFDRYGPVIYSLALHIVGNSQSAEKITQEVFVYLSNQAHLGTLGDSNIMNWLVIQTRERAIEQINLVPNNNHYAGMWALDGANYSRDGVQPTSSSNLTSNFHRQKQIMMQAVSTLPKEQQQVLALAYFRRFTPQQIAEILHQPVEYVVDCLRMAMQELKTVVLENSIDDIHI